jgi:curved DNA-binding protein CbpA
MLPNYYKVFVLNKTATKEEIKKRYRELAKRYHPDVNKSPDATAKMQEVQEAYYILSDEEARSRYDDQYDKIYGSKEQEFGYSRQSTTSQPPDEPSEQNSYQFDDPVLEKWILNAKRQSINFVKNLYRDTKGIAASGCSYYFKALGICTLIFIAIVILISLIRAFSS